MCSRRLLAISLAAVALGGCNTMYKHIGEDDPYFGESVRYNSAVQTINPTPVYAAGGAQPGGMGVKGADAVKRYRTDQVLARHNAEAYTTSTTSSVSSGSSGGPH